MSLFSPKKMFNAAKQQQTMFVDIESRSMSPQPLQTSEVKPPYSAVPPWQAGKSRVESHRDYATCREIYTYYDVSGRKHPCFTFNDLYNKGVHHHTVTCVDVKRQLYIFK